MTNTATEMTPFGPVPASHVIHVEGNETVKVLDGHLRRIDLTSGETLEDYGPVAAADTTALDPREHARELRLRHGIVESEEAPPPPPFEPVDLPGWTTVVPMRNIKSLATTWTVPQSPANQDKFICFWNGLDGGALQPVLYWHNGDKCYYLWPWAYIAGNYVNGNRMVVKPGTEVTGLVEYLGKDGDGYKCKVSFVGHPVLDFIVVRPADQGPPNNLIVCTEDRGQPLSDWPPDLKLTFRNIKLTMQPGFDPPDVLKWIAHSSGRPTPSGKNAVIVDGDSRHGVVDHYFH